MAGFAVRFLLCNLIIGAIVGILSVFRLVFRHVLSARMRYHLWFLLLGALAVPFLPFPMSGFFRLPPWLAGLAASPASDMAGFRDGARSGLAQNAARLSDFALSVSRPAPFVGYLLAGIWLTGIFVMLLLTFRSFLRMKALKKAALPLQNQAVRGLYQRCLAEMGITRDIPVYSTAHLKSPVITGLLNPRIYLPLHLISGYIPSDSPLFRQKGQEISSGFRESELRYMLLHELQHYRHKDALVNALAIPASILYWFNPLVWYALREMRSDREIACDSAVLNMLDEELYLDYGNTLIRYAEKISLFGFPFAAGLGGSMKQMRQRILHIASYEKPTFQKRLRGTAVFLSAALLVLYSAPLLSTCAAQSDRYAWEISSQKETPLELSSYFGEYEGSFVLYNLQKDSWYIHDMERALLRVSPDSTYKIYDALFQLEAGIITPEDSLIPWNHTSWPFEEWNNDQTLESAMAASVNWYFQELDARLGASALNACIRAIGYGNADLSGGLSDYWMENSLKISPIEQVELLTRLYRNDLDFAPQNADAVKQAICLSSSGAGTLYGKTGTGRVDGEDVNGWFVGYIEADDNTCFFALNISAQRDASGSRAAEIALSILTDMAIW